MTPESNPQEPIVNEQTPTDPVVTEPAADPAPAEPTPDPVDPPAEGEPAESTWEPNYNFKVLDKEYEIDEFVRPVITSAEQEEAVKQLYRKAYGIESIKEKHTKSKAEIERLKEFEGGYQEQTQRINYMNDLIKKKDFHTLFDYAKISQDDVLKHAAEILRVQEMTPVEQQQYNQQRQQVQQVYTLEQQNQQLQQQYQQQMIQNQNQALDVAIAPPEVKAIADAFDARLGEGAFRNEVISRAALKEQQTMNAPGGPVTLTADQAVKEVINLLGHQTPMPAANPAQPAPQQPVVPSNKPVIPNIRAGAQSPAKQPVKSIADLRKLANSIETGLEH